MKISQLAEVGPEWNVEKTPVGDEEKVEKRMLAV